MLKQFGEFLKRNGRMRIIPDRSGGGDYIHRYYLIFMDSLQGVPPMRAPDAGWQKPFNLFLHNILMSDEEYFHDHPWWYIALILKGGYHEHTPTGTFWRGPGSIRFSPANSLHHLELPKDHNGNCWTLFFHGPRVREWGFIDPLTQLWIRWDIWIERKRQKAAKDKLKNA